MNEPPVSREGRFRYGFDNVHRGLAVSEAHTLMGLLDSEGSKEARDLADRILAHIRDRPDAELRFGRRDLELLWRAVGDQESLTDGLNLLRNTLRHLSR
jgi:hypothetical protein